MKKWINKGNKPTRHGFGEGVLKAAETNPNVIGLGVDITGSVSMNYFAEKFPERFYSLGVAEQNAVGVAAGLALSGKTPVFSTYGVFSALRDADQVRISVCYNDVHVIIGGAHAGISVGPDGATHQALEDISIMRTLPNMTVLSACDAFQAREATIYAINELQGPAYIRFGREAVPQFMDESYPFEFGKAQKLTEGNDITIFATGHMTWEALQAADILQKSNIGARVINIHTIKPIDKEAIIKAARETKAALTIEEHQINGGFGSAVCEVLSENHPTWVKRIGMPDTFGESGKPAELMEKYGLVAENIATQARQLLQQIVD